MGLRSSVVLGVVAAIGLRVLAISCLVTTLETIVALALESIDSSKLHWRGALVIRSVVLSMRVAIGLMVPVVLVGSRGVTGVPLGSVVNIAQSGFRNGCQGHDGTCGAVMNVVVTFNLPQNSRLQTMDVPPVQIKLGHAVTQN